ncbi:MAG: Rab family GTPase [Candidatus Thorarchaeota archaeon]
MSLKSEKLFKELINNFLTANEEVEAVIISDHEGFVISGEKRLTVDIELVSVLTGLINPILERIRNEFAFKRYGTASFDTEEFRFLFIAIDENTTLSLALNILASIDRVSPYAFFLAEKVAQILNAQEDEVVQTIIPNFEIESDSSETSERIKNQIYQMRLDSGGVYKFKFVIIGDHEVGKTSIVRRFVENKFSLDYRATIGLNILSHSMEFYGNQVDFSLWDVGAQDYFKRFRKTYYLGVQAAFIVFDVSNRTSFDNVRKWHNELEGFLRNKDIPIVIVGNKIDLTKQRVVTYQEGVNLVNQLGKQNQHNDLSYIETSALTGENIGDAFTLIAYHYIMRSKEKEEEKLRIRLLELIDSIITKNNFLTLSFITESPYWNPGFQILNEINRLYRCEKIVDNKEKRIYEFSNGLKIKNHLFDNFDVSDSDGVFIIFDGRNNKEFDIKWREIVLNIVAQLEENRVALIGIRVTNDSDWSKIMMNFDLTEYLDLKMVSLVFFKLGLEYRLEIYDQLEVMFNSILNLL